MDRLTGWIAKAAYVFLYVPILAVVVYSFNASPTRTAWTGLSLVWYQKLLTDGPMLRTLQTSLTVGLITAVIATTIGFLSALALSRLAGRIRVSLLALLLLPLILPEIVLGAALLTTFKTIELPLGIPTLVAGHVIVCLPLATLLLMAGLTALDGSLVESAADLGCTPWQTFLRVLLPLMRPALLAALLLSFTTSFTNLTMSIFTAGVGNTTMPLRIYSMLKTGLSPEVNALGVLIIVATVIVIFAVGLGQMRRLLLSSRTAQ